MGFEKEDPMFKCKGLILTYPSSSFISGWASNSSSPLVYVLFNFISSSCDFTYENMYLKPHGSILFLCLHPIVGNDC